MSIAGPAANLSLTILASLLIHCGMWLGVFRHPESAGFTHLVDAVQPGAAAGVASLLSILFSLNLLLCLFNLIPIPPLDGFGAAGLLLPEDAAGRFQRLGHRMGAYSMLGLLVAWKVFGPIFDPVFWLSVKILYPSVTYGS